MKIIFRPFNIDITANIPILLTGSIISINDKEHALYKFYCFTVHFNSLNFTHQLMHFQYNNILI